MKKRVRKNGIYKGVSKRKLVQQVESLITEAGALEVYIQTACAGYQRDNQNLFKANKDLASIISNQEEEKLLLKIENEALCLDIKNQRDYIIRLEEERKQLRSNLLEKELEISKSKTIPWWMQRLVKA